MMWSPARSIRSSRNSVTAPPCRNYREGFWDLVQRVQDTAKAGKLTLTIHVAFNGKGQLEAKDEVSLKLPEYNRPTTRFFLDNQGNATRRDPNQPELPEIASMKNKLKGIS